MRAAQRLAIASVILATASAGRAEDLSSASRKAADALATALTLSPDAASIQQVAVLPFAEGPGASGQGRAAADVIGARFAEASRLGVVDDTAFRSAVGEQKLQAMIGTGKVDDPSIATKAGTQAVITGSVNLDGSRLRITARLTLVATGKILGTAQATADAGPKGGAADSGSIEVAMRRLSDGLAGGFARLPGNARYRRLAVLTFSEVGERTQQKKLGTIVTAEVATNLKRDHGLFLVERARLGEVLSEMKIQEMTSPDPAQASRIRHRVVGVGGAGCNAVNRMIEAGLRGVEFVAVNTDRQALEESEADVRIPVGMELTRGLGTGGDPLLGEQAVKESEDHVRRALRGSDLVFIAAGEGGGTGTGGAPIVAKIARELGALTVAVVTRPFAFEGNKRTKAADEGLSRLQSAADTVIVIPNDRLMSVLERGTSMVEAFKVADDLLRQGVQGICDMITLPGLINLDFADVRTIIRGAGTALLGIGYAGGGNRATEAAMAAIASPLLETPIDGAKGILLGVTGGPDLSLVEVSEAARVVADAADPDANIIFGATIDPDLQGQVWVTVVAANFSGVRAAPPPPPEPEPASAAPARPERGAAAPRPRRVTRFDVPYPTRARPSGEDAPGDAPRVFDVDAPSPPAPEPPRADPDATTLMRRPDLGPDEPEDAA